MKKKTRFVVKNLLIMLLGVLAFMLAISDWIIILLQNGTFTSLGLFINILELIVACDCYEYLEDYLDNKNN